MPAPPYRAPFAAAQRGLARSLRYVLGGIAVLTLLGASLPARGQGQPALRVLIPQSASPPFVVWRDGQPVEGLDIELAQALAQLLNSRAELQVLPRARIETALEQGEADIACDITPGPRGESSLRWSPPLFELNLMLVGHISAAPVDNLGQISSAAVIGTLQGQAYPALESAFSEGRLRRDEALSEDRLLRKLNLNRHPYGLLSRQILSWHAESESVAGLDQWRLPVQSQAYRCAIAPRPRVEARLLLDGIEQLLQRGRIEQMLNAYTKPALAVVVSTQSSLRRVDRQQLNELYTGQRQQLDASGAAAPLMSAGPERLLFLQSVLRLNAGQYRSTWAAQQFGGRRSPPLELRDAQSIKAHLLRHTQAIGYLPLSLVDPSLRVVYMP